MKDKHEAKKKDILESAFKIWGEQRYQANSLGVLASALSITKQALYRYFSSKEKLEQAMEDAAMEMYANHADNLADGLGVLSGDALVKTYVSVCMAFMSEKRQYLSFLSYRHCQRMDDTRFTQPYTKRFAAILMEKAQVPGVGLRYLNTLIFQEIHHRECTKITPDRWENIWEQGFASHHLYRLPDFEGILVHAATVDYSTFARDPLMKAVFETVIEEAGNQISLDKVAKKAGLTKSSLYNYWPNKETMLIDVLTRQISIYSDLFHRFAENYNNPTDIVFAYLAFLGTFLRRRPKILNYLQRVMSFHLGMPMDKNVLEERYTNLLKSVLSTLDLKGYDAMGFLCLMNLASVNEVRHHLTEESPRIHFEQGLKDLYRLVMGGIPTLRSTM